MATKLSEALLILRLDKFLKISRLIKRRTIANALCDGGQVWLNGKLSKPSAAVKVGDELLVTFGEQRQCLVRIIMVPTSKQVPPDIAKTLYEEVSLTVNNANQDNGAPL